MACRTAYGYGEADALREETGKSIEGALRGMGLSNCERIAKIKSGKAIYYATGGDLRYITNKSVSWVATVVDKGSGRSSIAVDASGNIHISYYGGSGDPKYAGYNGSSWSEHTLDSTVDVGNYSSIAVHSDGSIHISYYYVYGANKWLKYARF